MNEPYPGTPEQEELAREVGLWPRRTAEQRDLAEEAGLWPPLTASEFINDELPIHLIGGDVGDAVRRLSDERARRNRERAEANQCQA